MIASHVVFFIASLIAQPADLPSFFQEYAKTTTFYYESPDPELGPKMLKSLLKKENIEHPWFKKNDHVLLLVAAQLGDIAAGHAEIVRQYEAAFNGAPTAGRRVIARALMNCGDEETIKQVNAWLAFPQYAETRSELEKLRKYLADPDRQHVRDRAARDPDDLDLLWSNFFVTGEYAPIARILDVFDQPDAKDNEVMKRVARWSLGSNLQQHPKLLEIVKERVKDRPARSREVVDDLIKNLPDVKQLIGRWISQDEDHEPLVFEEDSSFQCGFIKEDGKWVMATGKYHLLFDGTIQTQATYQGSFLTQTFKLKDGVITGSRGPNPKVDWKKEKKNEKRD